MHVHAVEDMLAQPLPRPLGRGRTRLACECARGPGPACSRADGEGPWGRKLAVPCTGSAASFSERCTGWDGLRGPPDVLPPWCSGSAPTSWACPSRRPWRWSAGHTVGRQWLSWWRSSLRPPVPGPSRHSPWASSAQGYPVARPDVMGSREEGPGVPYMARELEGPQLHGAAQKREPSQGTGPAFWGGWWGTCPLGSLE